MFILYLYFILRPITVIDIITLPATGSLKYFLTFCLFTCGCICLDIYTFDLNFTTIEIKTGKKGLALCQETGNTNVDKMYSNFAKISTIKLNILIQT